MERIGSLKMSVNRKTEVAKDLQKKALDVTKEWLEKEGTEFVFLAYNKGVGMTQISMSSEIMPAAFEMIMQVAADLLVEFRKKKKDGE